MTRVLVGIGILLDMSLFLLACHKSSGAWRSFTLSYADRCASPELFVCLVGSAVFAKDTKELELAWLLRNQVARLSWIRLQQNDNDWLQIPFEHKNLMDPPIRPPAMLVMGRNLRRAGVYQELWISDWTERE